MLDEIRTSDTSWFDNVILISDIVNLCVQIIENRASRAYNPTFLLVIKHFFSARFARMLTFLLK